MNVNIGRSTEFMVTEPKITGPGEGWRLVDTALKDGRADVCASKAPGLPEETAAAEQNLPLPTFIHVTTEWVLPDLGWGYSKYVVPPGWSLPKEEGILGCEMPFLAEPPTDLLRRASTPTEKRTAWGLCTIVHRTNQMLQRVKPTRCPEGFNSDLTLKVGWDFQGANGN